MDLKVKIEEKKGKKGFYVIYLSGSLDTNTFSDCQKKVEAVIAQSPKMLIFNMKDLDYISSIGLGMVFRMKQLMEEKGGGLVITDLKPNIKKIFDMLRVIPESFFATMKDVDDYLDEFIEGMTQKFKEEEGEGK